MNQQIKTTTKIEVVRKVTGSRVSMPAVYVRDSVMRINAGAAELLNLGAGDVFQIGLGLEGYLYLRKAELKDGETYIIKSVDKTARGTKNGFRAFQVGSRSYLSAGGQTGIYIYENHTNDENGTKWRAFKRAREISKKSVTKNS